MEQLAPKASSKSIDMQKGQEQGMQKGQGRSSHRRTQNNCPTVFRVHYKVDVRWFEEPYEVRRKLKKGCVEMPTKPLNKTTRQKIIDDLCGSGEKFRPNYSFKIVDIQAIKPKPKPNFFIRFLTGEPKVNIKQYLIKCTIFERKINLPPGYQYQPEIFDGFVVENLMIGNEHGYLRWEGETNIENVQFDTGFEIKRSSVYCEIQALNKQAKVKFFTIPVNISDVNEQDAAKILNIIARGGKVIDFDRQENWWQIMVDFGCEQLGITSQQKKKFLDPDRTRIHFEDDQNYH